MERQAAVDRLQNILHRIENISAQDYYSADLARVYHLAEKVGELLGVDTKLNNPLKSKEPEMMGNDMIAQINWIKVKRYEDIPDNKYHVKELNEILNDFNRINIAEIPRHTKDYTEGDWKVDLTYHWKDTNGFPDKELYRSMGFFGKMKAESFIKYAKAKVEYIQLGNGLSGFMDEKHKKELHLKRELDRLQARYDNIATNIGMDENIERCLLKVREVLGIKNEDTRQVDDSSTQKSAQQTEPKESFTPASTSYNPVNINNLPKIIKDFIPPVQLEVINGSIEHEEVLHRLENIFKTMPVTYSQDGLGNQAIVFLHYFHGGSDWYITEKDSEDEQHQAFGYTILNGDEENAEWGYISIEELKDTKPSMVIKSIDRSFRTKTTIELDFYFTPKPLYEITKDEPKQLDKDELKLKEKIYSKYQSLMEKTAETIIIKPIVNAEPSSHPKTNIIKLPYDGYFKAVEKTIIDDYADNLIKQYEPKIQPLESQIEALKGQRDVKECRDYLDDQLKSAKSKIREAELMKKKPTIENLKELETITDNVIDMLNSDINSSFTKSDGILTETQKLNRTKQLEEDIFKQYIYEFYPTPVWVVEKMVEKADIQDGMDILEPSAGKGNICDIITSKYNVNIDVIELNDTLREILTLKGYTLVGNDFTLYSGKTYDRIIMNPPFKDGQDRKHIIRAYNMLKPGGRVVAISSYGAINTNEPTSIQFRKQVEKYGSYEVIDKNKYSEGLERKIEITTCIIEMKKPLIEEESKKAEIIDFLDAGEFLRNNYYNNYVYEVIGIDGDNARIKNLVTNKIENLTLPSFKFSKITKDEAYGTLELQPSSPKDGDGKQSEVQRGDGQSGKPGSFKCNLPSRREDNCNDPELKPVGILTISPELVKRAGRQYISKSTDEVLKEHQKAGVNLAIETLINNNCFILADGTGSGKTMQELAIAEYFLKAYPDNPVLLITESEKIINQAVFGDAEKLGLKSMVKVADKSMKTLTGKYLYTMPYYRLDEFIDEDHPIRRKIKSLEGSIQELRKRAALQKKEIDASNESKKEKIRLKKLISESVNDDPLMVDFNNTKVEWAEHQDEIMRVLAQNVSLVIFDESHNLKNYNEQQIMMGMRARRGMAISKYAGATLFASATPFDKVQHVFYIKKLGLWKTEEQYENFLMQIGYHWVDAKENKRGEIIRPAYWGLDGEFNSDVQLTAIDRLFEDAIEDGLMIKRELELCNMRIGISRIQVPNKAFDELTAIQEYFDNKDPEEEGSSIDRALVKMEQMRALEPYKIQEVVNIAKRELDESRNVVIFCGMTEEGKEPKQWGGRKAGTIQEFKEIFSDMYCPEAIGIVVGTGVKGVTQEKIEKDIDEFQLGKKRIILATNGAGGTGISLDDQYCDQPRTLICMTAPMSGNQNVQMLGRVYRANTKSITRAFYVFAKNVIVEEWLENIIADKMRMLNAVVKGQTSLLQFENIEAAQSGKAVEKKEKEQIHSLYSRKSIDGENLPSKKPYILERGINRWEQKLRSWQSDSSGEYIKFRGKTKSDIDKWMKEFPALVEKNNMEKKSNSYEGTYLFFPFTDEIWNILINYLKPEITDYIVTSEQAFQVGDIVKAKEDIIEAQAKTGDTGIILQVRDRQYTTKQKMYFYKVQFENGEQANRLEAHQLENVTPEPELSKTKFVEQYWNSINIDLKLDNNSPYFNDSNRTIQIPFNNGFVTDTAGWVNIDDWTTEIYTSYNNSLNYQKERALENAKEKLIELYKIANDKHKKERERIMKTFKNVNLSGLSDELDELENLINNSYR